MELLSLVYIKTLSAETDNEKAAWHRPRIRDATSSLSASENLIFQFVGGNARFAPIPKDRVDR
jgi:hypothetical protein